MEKFDLYDKNFHKLHKTMNRGNTNNPGEYHLVVHIWIKNSDNLFLIQQRNKLDDQIPFQWATTSGAALKGESSLEAIIREAKEEIGLTINQNNLQLLKRYFINHEKANYITDLYILKEDILIKELKLDTLEVRDVEYKTMSEIKQMIKNNQFWDYERILIREGYFNLLEKS